jgi:hypothetical protein
MIAIEIVPEITEAERIGKDMMIGIRMNKTIGITKTVPEEIEGTISIITEETIGVEVLPVKKEEMTETTCETKILLADTNNPLQEP